MIDLPAQASTRPSWLFVPDDLQTSDPSLLSEISSGHFGLDGIFIELEEGGPSIFEHPEPDDSYNRVLHGFGWLRDLRARDDFEAQKEAQRLVFIMDGSGLAAARYCL